MIGSLYRIEVSGGGIHQVVKFCGIYEPVGL